MSKYTTEVRFICENYAGLTSSAPYPSVNQIIQSAIPKIFDFKFPIFDETYRNVLETKILKHYYTREIAFETVGLWLLKLDTKLNEIMPYYNQLYESAALDFNPFYDVDLTRDHVAKRDGQQNVSANSDSKSSATGTVDLTGTQDVNGSIDKTSTDTETNHITANQKTDGTAQTTTTQTETNTLDHMDAFSDTPQGSLTGVADLNYLTNARKIDDTGTTSTDTTTNGTTGDTRESTSDANSSINRESNQTDKTTTDTSSNTTSKNDVDTTATTASNTIMTNTEDYLEHVKGKQGVQSYSSLLAEFRETFLNIDMMVIEELNDLFFTLY